MSGKSGLNGIEKPVLKSADVWEVNAGPPLNTLKGHIILKPITKNHRRRISVEVHSIKQSDSSIKDEVFVRFLDLGSRKHASAVNDDVTECSDTSNVTDGWFEKYKFPLDCVTVNKVVGKTITMTTIKKHKNQTREVTFNSDDEAKAFETVVKQHKSLDYSKKKGVLQSAVTALGIAKGTAKVNILIEVVSAFDLPIGDAVTSTSDPYVVIKLNRVEIHRTKYVASTLKPIWTVKTNSLCLLRTTSNELFRSSDGLVFEIMDYDTLSSDTLLGVVKVPAKVVYEGKGERLQYKAKKQRSDGGERVKGNLFLRFRHATDYDINFVEKLYSGQLESTDTPRLKGGFKLKNIMGGDKKTDNRTGNILYRVKPYVDPKRPKDTEWITKEFIDRAIYEESRKWVDMGSGKLARLFVEILKCDNLPNLDSKALGGKTDAVVSVIYEDCIAEADRIDNCLSPRWLPWSQRAFIFHMMHPSSQIFIGIFDYDEAGSHDFIGRCAIDLTNFSPQTEYKLSYNLRKDPGALSDYLISGLPTITIRLKIEYMDQRALMMEYLAPPPVIHVNVKTLKEYDTARAQVYGDRNLQAYSINNLFIHIEELSTYYQLLCMYLYDASVVILFWRGSFPFKIPYTNKTVFLPIHSTITFLCLTTLVENPSLFPSYFFGLIAWTIYSSLVNFNQSNPSPWIKCKSFEEFIFILLTGKSKSKPWTIKENENIEEVKDYIQAWKKRMETAEENTKANYEHNAMLQEEQAKYLDEVQGLDSDIATKKKSLTSALDPFEPYIHPIQLQLGSLCNMIRISKYIVLWQECYYSFFVTVISALLSVIFYFIPWGWILIWLSRFIVWTVFGPHMKLVDIFYFRKLEHLSPAERAKQRKQMVEETRLRLSGFINIARIAKENAEKLKALKVLLFGKYIIHIPTLKIDRYRDIPLPNSTATPIRKENLTMAELSMKEGGQNRQRIPGQQLVGDMIPIPVEPPKTDAPKGQPTGDNLVGNVKADSAISAYTKIGIVFFCALGITWFSVPRINYFVQWLQNLIWSIFVFVRKQAQSLDIDDFVESLKNASSDIKEI